MAENELNTLEVTGEQPPIETLKPSEPEPTTEEKPVDTVPDATNLQGDIEALEARRKKAEQAAREAEEKATYWRRQKAQERADYFRGQQKPPETPTTPAQSGPPKVDDFDDYNDFVRAQADFAVEQKKRQWDAEQAQKAENEARQQKMANLQERINEGFTKYDDFEEIAMDQTVPITPAVMEILAESEAPADVAYYLGKNRTQAIAISRMTPTAAARAIAKIEAEISANPAPPPKKTTSAPPPIKPLGSGPAAITKDPRKMSQAEYEEYRRQQGARMF